MILICYPPGARGDFLAAILVDDFEDHYTKYALKDFTVNQYEKIHWCNEILGMSMGAYNARIRIALNDLDDFLTVEHLARSKLPTKTPSDWLMKELLDNEFIGRESNNMFTHVIDFKLLFDVDYIINLYKDINKRNLDPNIIDKIKYNIALQQWVHRTISCKP